MVAWGSVRFASAQALCSSGVLYRAQQLTGVRKELHDFEAAGISTVEVTGASDDRPNIYISHAIMVSIYKQSETAHYPRNHEPTQS